MNGTGNERPSQRTQILICLEALPIEQSTTIVRGGLALVPTDQCDIHILHVLLPPEPYVALAERPVPLDEAEIPALEHARAWLAGVCAASACHARTLECLGHREPWRAILERADAHNAHYIVLGSHGRSSWQSLWLGSVTQRVIAHAKVPVLVVR